MFVKKYIYYTENNYLSSFKIVDKMVEEVENKNPEVLIAEEVKTLSRVPQYMSFDINALETAYQEEAILVRDITLFFINHKMKNLWGEVTFTLEDFCKEMGYDRTTLSRTLPQFSNPSPKTKLPTFDDHVFDSVFEYPLYRALKENILVSKKLPDGIEIKNYRIISTLRVDYSKHTKKATKRYYTIQLSEELLDNVFKEYFLIDYGDYKALTGSGSLASMFGHRNFYLFMAQIINHGKYELSKGKENKFITSVDKLAEILKIKIAEPKERKRKVKDTLNKLKKYLANTPFDFEFVKNGTSYAYFVQFTFEKETLEYFDERQKSLFFHRLYDRLNHEFLKANNLITGSSRYGGNFNQEIYNKANSEETRRKFAGWFANANDTDEDRALKHKTFRAVYYEVYGEHYPPNKEIDFKLLEYTKPKK